MNVWKLLETRMNGSSRNYRSGVYISTPLGFASSRQKDEVISEGSPSLEPSYIRADGTNGTTALAFVIT